MPAVVAVGTVPVTLAPGMFVSPAAFPVKIPVFAVMLAAVMVPLTPNDVIVPTDVIFGCADVVSVPVNKLAPILPELA